MNKTTFTIAAIAAAAPILAAASPAGASTSGCETARFECGTFVQYAEGMNTARPGWAASADAAGAPLVMERDTAGNPAADFAITDHNGDVRFELAEHGIRSGLYVGVTVSSYPFHGREVRPGTLILMGWNNAYQERWTMQGDHGGTEVSNDYSSEVVAPSGVGQVVRTVPVPLHRSSVAWRINGNEEN